jgi:hypothetical protein
MKRASLTPKERDAMLKAQGGRCATPGCEHPPAIAEHTLPVALGNPEKPDCLLCWPCAKAKTVADVWQIAKAKRQAKYHTTGKGRARKGRPLQGRGFPKHITRRMDGTIIHKGQ